MTKLGKYDVIEEIGRGRFAVVYRARDPDLDRVVALKVLHPQLTVDPTFIERFKREARTAAVLDHPHIATVYEVRETAGQLYIAMEFARGPSLAERIQEQGPLAWEETLEVLEQVSSALDYVHEQGFVHRDIKPSNILLDPDKGALLGDFGLSKMIESSGHSLTASGSVLGTPAYIAPEIWAGERPTAASDVYALGCVLYEMITGEVLFGTDSPLIVMKRHDEVPHLDTSKVEEGFRTILLKAFEKSPDGRYQRAGEFADALKGEWKRLRAAQQKKQQQEHIANLLAAGQQDMRKRQWDEAIASFEVVLGIDSENRAAQWGLARARRAQGRATRASRPVNHTKLRDNLKTYFNESELRNLCEDLRIDYEDLPNETKVDMVRELVRYCVRHGRLSELLRVCKQKRPHVIWDVPPQGPTQTRTPVGGILQWIHQCGMIGLGGITPLKTIGIITIFVVVAVGTWQLLPAIRELVQAEPTVTPTLSISEAVIEIDGQLVTEDEQYQVVCNSYPRIEVYILNSAGDRVQPDVFSYNWYFHPGDLHNKETLDSKNYAINYHVPCERDSQTITVEVLEDGGQLYTRSIRFNISK